MDNTFQPETGSSAMTRSGIAAALAAVFFTAPAWALNEDFLKDAPVSRLSEDEFKALWAFTMETLDTAPDGKTVEWSAAKTAFTSRLTPQKSFTDGGLKCRDLTIDSDSRDRQMRGVYTFCKKGKDWEFKTPSPAR
jgi:surface antigen